MCGDCVYGCVCVCVSVLCVTVCVCMCVCMCMVVRMVHSHILVASVWEHLCCCAAE